MKNTKLLRVNGITDKGSNAHVLSFFFGEGRIAGYGKAIRVKMGTNYTAKDVADALIKAGAMIYEELKKD